MLYLLASYPKSGNTMVRIFLAHYLRQNEDLNKVGFPLYGSNHYFPFGMPPDRSIAVPVCRDHPCFAKTHETADFYYPASAHRCLYIVRNPLDVAPSWSDHMMCTLDHAVHQMTKPVKLQGTEQIFPQEIGSWSSHVSGWLTAARIPVRAVRYETLVSDPRRGFKVVLDWLELPFDEARFSAALEFVQFKNLKKLEHSGQFKESRGARGFFRRGESGSWRDSLTFAQAEQLLSDHWGAMKLAGYVT